MSENLPNYLELRHHPENVNAKHKKNLALQDKIALLITRAVGTMYAVCFFSVVIAGWMLWQAKIDSKPFDPYPFAFLLFIGNIVQLLLMPLIMVGQNLQNKHAELRAEEEYKTTESIYRDIEKILVHLNTENSTTKERLN